MTSLARTRGEEYAEIIDVECSEEICWIPKQVLAKALELVESGGNALASVSYLCRWWNDIARADRRGADHFGVYIYSEYGFWKNAWYEDRTLRPDTDLLDSRSSGFAGNTIIEFRRTVIEDGYRIAFNMAGEAIESLPSDFITFERCAEMALDELAAIRKESSRAPSAS